MIRKNCNNTSNNVYSYLMNLYPGACFMGPKNRTMFDQHPFLPYHYYTILCGTRDIFVSSSHHHSSFLLPHKSISQTFTLPHHHHHRRVRCILPSSPLLYRRLHSCRRWLICTVDVHSCLPSDSQSSDNAMTIELSNRTRWIWTTTTLDQGRRESREDRERTMKDLFFFFLSWL